MRTNIFMTEDPPIHLTYLPIIGKQEYGQIHLLVICNLIPKEFWNFILYMFSLFLDIE